MNPFKRTINNGFGDSKLSLPRTGLLLYLGRPNLEAADVPIGDDTEIGDDTIIRWMFLLPADADIRAATGWVSGTANLWYTSAGASVAVSSAEIEAWAGINQYHILFSATKGLAIYDPMAVTIPTLVKAAKWMRINGYAEFVQGGYYKGLDIGGQEKTWTSIPRADWYVDSIRGSDAAEGTTPVTAFATIGKLLDQSITAGKKVGLAAGSYWRERLFLTAINDLQVFGYGNGPRPVLDAADIVPNASFSLSAGTTHVYQLAWSHEILSTTSYLRVWEDGESLTYVASEVLCESTPGSFYVPYPFVSGALVKVHASDSSDITINGKLYEIPKRDTGLHLNNSTGHTVSFIRTRRNGGNNGSMQLGHNCIQYNCLFEDGVKHNGFIESGLVDECIAWKNEKSSRTGRTLFIGFTGDGRGKSLKYRKCLSIGTSGSALLAQPFLSHTDGAGFEYDSFIIEDCATINTSGIGARVKHFELTRTKIRHQGDTAIDFSGVTENAILTDTFVDSRDAVVNTKSLQGSNSSATITIDGFRLLVGPQYANNSNQMWMNGNVQISNSVFYKMPGAYLIGAFWEYVNSAQTPKINNCIFHGFFRPYVTAGVLDNTSDNNCFYTGGAYKLQSAGVDYTAIATYKAAVAPTDANSIVGDPLFVDPVIGNFSLQVGSPAFAIEAGLLRPDVQYLDILDNSILSQW